MAFLKWEDYVIFAITLFLSLGIGLFYSLRGTKQRTARQFILGDGNMWTLPVALSLMVSNESGVMMLGVPAEVYMYGMQWYMASIAGFFSHLVTLHLLIPAQRELPITSMNQYFELRYNSRGLRLFATIISLLSSANYLGSVVFVPAITLEMVTGIPMWISIVTLTVVVLIYTILGGFTAVIWTDVFQAVLMFVGMFAILIKGTIEAGGVKNTWTIIWEKGRINLLDFNPDPTIRQSFWSLFVGGLINGLRLQFAQPTFQRVKATPTLSTAKCMFLLASIMFLVISGLAVMEGAIMFAYYHAKGCDPLEDNQVRNQNQLIAVMVRDIFQDTPCLPGLFLAALFSASLSTMSSVLSAMSAIFLEDIVKPHTKPMSDKQAIRIAQLSVLGFGGLAIAIAFGISGIEGPVSRILDITEACLSGTVGGLFLLGWFVPIANSVGGLAGGVVSFVVVGWISFGKLISKGVRVSPQLEPASTENCPVFNFSSATSYENTSALWNDFTYTTEAAPTSLDSGQQGLDVLYSLSYKWLTPVGICLVLIVGSLVSLLQDHKPVHPSLVVPVCDYLCVCFPESIRRIFRCGVKYPKANEGSAEDSVTAELTVQVCSAPEHMPLDQGNQNSVW
ncbi:sodium-coupled monocarboxylate transporter 1-like [Mizuhopecten yessoensis]|uniref:Sodium-coupled monocarboxylate transporter 1 n=1 Tax=Mizuhopecten yessoensis TaxID=6573 RepID=A0A210QUF3_MIZYE|nr:sodium-coupled monocarboxylate transporter 1-like [Mizuhopecten yessoensis]XP_021349530.1 sodium-coupled monocarboxylate transporter 1-like [Mizuhopecten yessoensis]OWF52336.1 Sodium-coupled monocarboxylate transporter 1 [Mizuhopecten yessoensis]